MQIFTKPSKLTLMLCGTVLALALASPANAQIPDAATTTADPSRLQNEFLNRSDLPNVSSRIQVRDLILQKTPQGAENITLNLKNITLQGVSVYAESELEAVYADKIGTTITLADVYGIATALTNKYRNDGYILTQVIVPPQTIDGGTVKLRIIEGFVSDISVEGADNPTALALVNEYTNGINTDKALNVKDLERSLLLISDLPGLDARSVLSPSPSQTGAANLQIIVERDQYDATIGVNNHGSRFLGPVQFSGAVSANSVFGNNERITGQIVTAIDPGAEARGNLELGFFSVAYEQPVPSLGYGTNIELLASYTDTTPGFDLEQFEIEGVSRFARVKLEHPFLRSRSENFNAHLAFDWRDVKSQSIVQDTLEDNIRAVRVGGDYEFLDTAFGVGINAIGFEISRGLDVLGSSRQGDDNLSRGFGNPSFTKATLDVQRLQRINNDFNLLFAATGQISDSPLLSSEEFGVGGNSFGRGYDPSEIVGDDGLAGKLELQWNNALQVDGADDIQLFGFVDGGRIFNDDATTADQNVESISSTGIGIRTGFSNGIDADAYVALPLSRDVDTAGDQEPRFFFSVNRSF